MSSSRAARRGLLQISLASVLWGTGGLAVQLVRERVPMSALTVSAYRLVLASFVLIAALAALRRLAEMRLTRGTVLVGLGTAAYQVLYFAAVIQVGVTVATVVSLGIAPVLLAVGESVHDHAWPGVRHLAALAAAILGLVLVSASATQQAAAPRPWLGVALAVGSGAAYATVTGAARMLSADMSPLALTTTSTTVGGMALLLLALAAPTNGPLWTSDPVVVALIGYLAIATMALAYGLLYAGLRVTRGSTATVATLLEPVTAALAAAAMLGERVGAGGAVGAVLILLAVLGHAV